MNRIQRTIEEFCGFLLTEKSASVNTVAAYRSDLGQLADFMETRSITDSWKGLDRSTIQDFILDLKARGYTETSVARKVAAIRSFFSFLAAGGTITGNPTEDLASPHIRRSSPTTLTSSEIDELMEQPTRKSTPEAMRDLAMLELLYATGMRVTELVSMDVGHLSLQPHSAYVQCTGRRSKQRSIPIHENAVEALNTYLEDGRPVLLRNRGEPALFLNRRGERLTRQGFWFILKGYARSAHLSRDITPHTLRHSFAAHMLRGGMPLRNVQEMMGHANISTTQVYTHLTSGVIRKAYERRT